MAGTSVASGPGCLLVTACIVILGLASPGYARDPILMRSEKLGTEEVVQFLEAAGAGTHPHASGRSDLAPEWPPMGSNSNSTVYEATRDARPSPGTSILEQSREAGDGGNDEGDAPDWTQPARGGPGSTIDSGRVAVAALVGEAIWQDPGASDTGDSRSVGGSMRPMPTPDSGPVRVQVGLWLRKFYGIDFGAGDWTVDVVFTLAWEDGSAARNAVPEGTAVAQLSVQDAQALFWLPDVGILYSTQQELLSAIVRVTANGNVTFTRRILVSVMQTFHKSRYPFDSHVLSLKIGSRSCSSATLVLVPARNRTAITTGVSHDFVQQSSSGNAEREWMYVASSFSLRSMLVNDGLIRRSTAEAHVTMQRNAAQLVSWLLMPEVMSVGISWCGLWMPPTSSMAAVRVVLSLSAFVGAVCCLVFHVDPQLGYEVLTWFHVFKEACALLAFEAVVFCLMIEVTSDKFGIDALTLQTANTARGLQILTTMASCVLLNEAVSRDALFEDGAKVMLVVSFAIGFFILWIWYQARRLLMAVEELEEIEEFQSSSSASSASEVAGANEPRSKRIQSLQAITAASVAAAASVHSSISALKVPEDQSRGWRRGRAESGNGAEVSRAAQPAARTAPTVEAFPAPAAPHDSGDSSDEPLHSF